MKQSAILAFIFLLAIFITPFALAEQVATVTLSWGANSESNLVGYKVYYGTEPGSYLGTNATEGDSPITINLDDLSDSSNPAYTIQFISDGVNDVTEYFALTAFDTDGLESDFSEEVSTVLNYFQEDVDVNENPPATPVSVTVTVTVTINQ